MKITYKSPPKEITPKSKVMLVEWEDEYWLYVRFNFRTNCFESCDTVGYSSWVPLDWSMCYGDTHQLADMKKIVTALTKIF